MCRRRVTPLISTVGDKNSPKMNQPLPPGQRDIATFPRFGLTQFARRFPRNASQIELEIIGNVEHPLHLSDALAGLPRIEQISDFHCVTTWSHRSLRWGGVRFADFYEKVVVPKTGPRPEATLVALRGQDGARTGMLLIDLLNADVLLADTLEAVLAAVPEMQSYARVSADSTRCPRTRSIRKRHAFCCRSHWR